MYGKLLIVSAAAFVLVLVNARTPQQDGLLVQATWHQGRSRQYYDYNATISNPYAATIKGNYSLMDILPRSPYTAPVYNVTDLVTSRFMGKFSIHAGLNMTVFPRGVKRFYFST